MTTREVTEGTQPQGEDEAISYTLDVSTWGSSPTSISVAVYDTTDYSDVTSTVMPAGASTVAGDVITLPALRSLSRDRVYRVEVKFTVDGNELEAYFHVRGER